MFCCNLTWKYGWHRGWGSIGDGVAWGEGCVGGWQMKAIKSGGHGEGGLQVAQGWPPCTIIGRITKKLYGRWWEGMWWRGMWG
jgi:hypothetical protein